MRQIVVIQSAITDSHAAAECVHNLTDRYIIKPQTISEYDMLSQKTPTEYITTKTSKGGSNWLISNGMRT